MLQKCKHCDRNIWIELSRGLNQEYFEQLFNPDNVVFPFNKKKKQTKKNYNQSLGVPYLNTIFDTTQGGSFKKVLS